MNIDDNTLKNVKKPEGECGKETLLRMNRSHQPLTEWAFSLLNIPNDAVALDIGCGGGNALKMLSARIPDGKLYGIDYSETSVEVAQKNNEKDVKSGKMIILHGSVSDLPFDEDIFDLIVTVESYFFWPDLAHDFREVRRVLKSKGTFAVIAEMYKHKEQDAEQLEIIDKLHMHNNTPEELKDMLLAAGFSQAEVHTMPVEGRICAIAVK